MGVKWNDFFSGTTFTAISGIASIAGLILSIILIIITAKVTKIINKKIKNRTDIDYFNKNRGTCLSELVAYQNLIKLNNILDIKLISDINNVISKIENSNTVLTTKDKRNIKNIKKELQKDVYSMDSKTKQNICTDLSYFIGRLNKEEIIL